MTQTPLRITELALRDGHQSLFATRMRLDDMLPIAEKMDAVGYWSIESWGGATFDSCIRFLGEDPWLRIRELKKVMPKTKQQMLLRGQNLLGYRHYADDLVEAFVERAYASGVEVFRIFDALNDPRNLYTSVKAVKAVGGHAQGTLSFTHSPVHNLQYWIDTACGQEDLGIESLAIKDMSGLLTPSQAFELIQALKQRTNLQIHLHCHATTGLSTATFYKAVEAGVDVLDTAISSLSQTYSHTATETVVAMLGDTQWDTGLDMSLLEDIGLYFREVRKKYVSFEGSLKGIDSRILVAQVPGGMLTNLESQLKDQNAGDKMDAVIEEIPRVRKDLGYLPLVTPTSQIVGTQAVLNVLSGQSYKTLSRETQALIRGEYGATPAPISDTLKQLVLEGKQPIRHRPADDLEPELTRLGAELESLAQEHHFKLSEPAIDDLLIYALFPQPGLHFLKNRDNPDAFEPIPSASTQEQTTAAASPSDNGNYRVKVGASWFDVEVHPDGDKVTESRDAFLDKTPVNSDNDQKILAPMSGTIVDIRTEEGSSVQEGDTLFILEAMKMETEIKSTSAGTVGPVLVTVGNQVQSGQPLVAIS